MTFANASAFPQDPTTPTDVDQTITQPWWPEIKTRDAREIVRISGTVTQERLVEALQNAIWSVNQELAEWSQSRRAANPSEETLTDDRLVGLYRRAVYHYAKAELIERYRDFDMTNAGSSRDEDKIDGADDARRNLRWAISDILGRSRVTVEAL